MVERPLCVRACGVRSPPVEAHVCVWALKVGVGSCQSFAAMLWVITQLVVTYNLIHLKKPCNGHFHCKTWEGC